MQVHVREKTTDDIRWITPHMKEHWGSEMIVTRGRVHNTKDLSGFVAEQGGKPLGIILYKIEPGQCEIVFLESFLEKMGIGTHLIDHVKKIALKNGCHRVWVITTNDNLAAMRFYQMRGFQVIAVHRNAIEQSRELKPEIPLKGIDGLPLRDEIILELRLK